MNALLLLTATAALGIDVGYQPLQTGGVEYIIQIEPQLLAELARGQEITSEVPAGLDVRRYRITVGTGPLPRQLPSSLRDGRPQMQPDVPTETRPHMHIDERENSRPVMRPEEASPASATQDFPREAQSAPREAPPRMALDQPVQQPFERRPFGVTGVTAESQQSRPVMAPELDSAPPVQQQPPQEQPFNNPLGPRYARETTQSPPRAIETASRPIEIPQRSVVEPAPTSQFGRPPQVYADPTSNQNRLMLAPQNSTTTNKPLLSEADAEAAREAAKPWYPFWTALFGLFCSAGGNVYLGWMTWSARMKYYNLVQKFRSQPSPA